MRGRAFAFITLVAMGWATGRVAMTLPAQPANSVRMPVSMRASAKLAVARLPVPQTGKTTPEALQIMQPKASVHTVAPRSKPADPAHTAKVVIGRLQTFAFPAANTMQPAASGARAERNTPAPHPATGGKMISAYAYSFWRPAHGATGLASAGQYGGSQTGFIVTINPNLLSKRFETQGLSILFRAALAPQNGARQEAATGLRWQPLRHVPVSVSIERRFYDKGSSRTASYVAAGVDNVSLPAKLRLDAFGQAGFVSGADAGGFYDLAVHGMRRIGAAGGIEVEAGAGVWSGGQNGTHRLDVGPSLRSKMHIGGKTVRIDADWRFRVGGNADPASGPAITLSTSF